MSRGARLVIKLLTRPPRPLDNDSLTSRVASPALHLAAGSGRSDPIPSFSRELHCASWNEENVVRKDGLSGRKSRVRVSGIPSGRQQHALSSLAADQADPSDEVQLEVSAPGLADSGKSSRPAAVAATEAATTTPKPKQKIATNGLTVKAMGDILVSVMLKDDPARVQALYEDWLQQTDLAGQLNKPNLHIIHMVMQSMRKLQRPLFEIEQFVEKAGKRYGIVPTRTTFNILLTTAFHRRDVQSGERVWKKLEESTVPQQKPNAESYNCIIFLKAIEKKIGQAVALLQKMLQTGCLPNKIAYNELLRGCARTRRTSEAAVILTALKSQHLMPAGVILTEMMVSAGEAEDAELAQLTVQMVGEYQTSPMDEGSFLIMLNFAAREGHTSITEACWPLILKATAPGKPSVPSFLARMHAYATSHDLKSAFRAVADLERHYSPPDSAGQPTDPAVLCPFTSLQPLVLACCRNLVILDSSYEQLAEMHAAGEVVSVACLNAVILACANLYEASRGYETFEAISSVFGLVPSIDSYSALVHCFGACKELKYAKETYLSIEKNGLKPNARAYAAIVDAHITSADAQGALEYLQAMIACGYVPQRDQLKHLYRRSQRETLPEGWQWARHTSKQLGYRDLEHEAAKRKIVNEEGAIASAEHREGKPRNPRWKERPQVERRMDRW